MEMKGGIDGDSCGNPCWQIDMLAKLDSAPVANAYCTCGRIVVLDRSVISMKIALGKEIQCMSCRNARISREIDTLNDIFNGVVEEEC